MKIWDVESGYVIKNDLAYEAEEIKNTWDIYDDEEKEGWREGIAEYVKADARAILNDLFEHFEEDGYEDMAEKCWDSVSNEQIAELQKVLDDICSNGAFMVIKEGRTIDAE